MLAVVNLQQKRCKKLRSYEVSKDKIVLLSTHVVSDVEFISKEILVMKAGRIKAAGSPQSLLDSLKGRVFEVLVTPEEQRVYEDSNYKLSNIMLTQDRICLRVVSDTYPQVGQIQEVYPNLEDVYLYLAE